MKNQRLKRWALRLLRKLVDRVDERLHAYELRIQNEAIARRDFAEVDSVASAARERNLHKQPVPLAPVRRADDLQGAVMALSEKGGARRRSAAVGTGFPKLKYRHGAFVRSEL